MTREFVCADCGKRDAGLDGDVPPMWDVYVVDSADQEGGEALEAVCSECGAKRLPAADPGNTWSWLE